MLDGMNAMSDEDLRRAYEATSYVLALPDGEVVLRVGEPAPELDAWLKASGYRDWAWMTAVNPRSRCLAEDENARRFDDLKSVLRARGREWLAGRAVADDRRWPDEPSVLVPGIGRTEASALAGAYGQAAILCGCNGSVPMLLWIARKP